jgi:hypothetical protein
MIVRVVLSGSEYAQVFFYRLFIYTVGDPAIQRGELRYRYNHSPLHIFVPVPSQDLDSNVIWRGFCVL